MALAENVKKWVRLDNEIKNLTSEIRLLRLQKDEYNTNILDYISENSLDNAIINLGDGRLKFIDVNHTKPLTYKFVCECLCDYFKDDDETVMEIICHIKSKRNIKTTREIRRYGPLKTSEQNNQNNQNNQRNENSETY